MVNNFKNTFLVYLTLGVLCTCYLIKFASSSPSPQLVYASDWSGGRRDTAAAASTADISSPKYFEEKKAPGWGKRAPGWGKRSSNGNIEDEFINRVLIFFLEIIISKF
jgi:hypothetical protein